MRSPVDVVKGRIVDIDERSGTATICAHYARQGFFRRYHLGGGITLDKTLCRIYGLKARRK